MSEEQYHSASHCKYLTQYHIIWCPKFRFSVLQNGADDALKSILDDNFPLYANPEPTKSSGDNTACGAF